MRNLFVVGAAAGIAVLAAGCSPQGRQGTVVVATPVQSAKQIVNDGTGGLVLPDGTRVVLDRTGGFSLPNGAYVRRDSEGALNLPNGARCLPDRQGGYLCP